MQIGRSVPIVHTHNSCSRMRGPVRQPFCQGYEYVSHLRLPAMAKPCMSGKARRGTQKKGRTAVHTPGWYVIQVQTGREAQAIHAIERVCAEADLLSDFDEPLLTECFTPYFRTQHKFHGTWQYVEKRLLPGYVIAVTMRPDERVWIEEFTSKHDRTIPMSFAYREGDTLVVTQGPLKGREGIITRVNRKKSLAFVELQVGGKRVTTTVGLGIVPKEES